MRERLGALRNLPPFMRIVWETSRPLTIAQGVLRLGRALLPVAAVAASGSGRTSISSPSWERRR